MIRCVAVLVAAAVLGVAACGGHPSAGRSPAPAGASGAGGDIVVTGAYVGDAGAADFRPVYLTIRSTGRSADLLEAAIAPLARSTTWAVATKVHTPAEIAAYAEPCGANPELLAQSNAALAQAGDVIVPAGGVVELAPGVARLQLNDVGPLRRGSTVPLTLWFASGARVDLDVPVTGPRQPDSLVD